MPQGAPDEGADLNGDEFAGQWETLKRKADTLKADAEAHAWWLELRMQSAHANVDYHSGGGHRSARRFELLRATLLLAGTSFAAEEQVKSLVISVTGDEAVLWPVITPGHAVGSLNAEQAARFAELVDHAVNGCVNATHHDTHVVYIAA